jgi:hypothetical protein
MRGIPAFWLAIGIVVVLAGGLVLAYFGVMAYLRARMSSPAAARMVRSNPQVRAAEAAIQAEVTRIKAAGEPVTAAQITLPPVPEAENAAALYEKAFGAVKLTEDDRSALAHVLYPRPGSSRDRWIGAARAIVARDRRALDLTYQATARPRCRFPVEWQEGAAVLLPHLSKMRGLSRLISAQGVLLSIDGDVSRTLQAVRAGIELGDALAQEPDEVSQLVRYRLYQDALQALQAVLSTHRLPAAIGKPLYDRLAAIQIMGPFKRAALGERAAAVTLYQIAESDPKRLGITLSPVQKTILPPAWTLDAARWLPLMSRRITLVDQPYRAVRSQLMALDVDGREMGKNESDPVAQMLFTGFDGWASSWWEQRDMAIARIGLARTALALRAYQAQNGSYPASIKVLHRAIGWRIPQDPFSGRGFVYKREGETALIYSIGPDLQDNGGAPLRGSASTESPHWAGDILWSLSR